MDPIQCAKEGNVEFLKAADLNDIQNSRDGLGSSVLSVAAKAGHLNCCEVIYRRCPQLLYEANRMKATALHEAIETRNAHIVEFLIYARAKAEVQIKGVEGDIEMGGMGEAPIAPDSKLLMMVDDERDTALHYAARNDCVESAKLLISADPNKMLLMMVNRYKRTALHQASLKNSVGVAKLLIEVDPGNQVLTMVCKRKWTALHYAAKEGHLHIAQLLIAADPSNKLLTMVDKWNQTVLHHAARGNYVEIAKLFIDVGSSNQLLMMVDKWKQTALHRAVRKSCVEIARLLIDGDSSNQLLMMANNWKRTALHHAAWKGCIEAAKLLIGADRSGILLTMTDMSMCTALHFAAAAGHPSVAQLLLDADPSNELLMMVDYQKCTALHYAAKEGQLKLAELLVNVDPSQKLLMMVDSDKWTALYYAAMKDHHDVTQLLIDADSDRKMLMMVDGKGNTALHLAAKYGKYKSAEILINSDPSNKLLMMVDTNDNTALHHALVRGDLEFAKLLITKTGPESNILLRMTNNENDTAIAIAIEKNLLEFVDFLLDANPHFSLDEDISRSEIPAEFWRLTNVRRALLGSVANKENINTLTKMIQKWPECLECINSEEQNIFHLAAKFEQESLVKFILELTDIPPKVLNMKDINGNTPMHIATSTGNQALILSLLYDHRIDKLILNNHRKGALDKINFDYDKRRARVYGLTDRLDEKLLKDRSDFDLLVGALISTLSFTAGIAVPGGYMDGGRNEGNAVLYKKISFDLFVISNTIALVLSLAAVFSHFCTRRLITEEGIIYQLKVATYCSLGSIFAMVVAFMTGSYTVLAVSHWLAITVCVISSGFFGIAFPAMWRMIREQRQRRPYLNR